MPRIVVIGSINMDLVTVAPRFPGPGETLLGERFVTVPGGKGANQAVAAARLGADVAMVGALGNDAFGQQLRQGLLGEGIDLSTRRSWRTAPAAPPRSPWPAARTRSSWFPRPTPGSRRRRSSRPHGMIARADAVLVQMEIPLEAVEATLRLGRRLDVPVILNPAPAQQLPTAWLELARYVTPNQHELAILLGAEGDGDFRELMQRAPCPVVLTRGGRRCLVSRTGGAAAPAGLRRRRGRQHRRRRHLQRGAGRVPARRPGRRGAQGVCRRRAVGRQARRAGRDAAAGRTRTLAGA